MLCEMHRQRKALFIDAMGWSLEACIGLEIDQFDKAEAIYLIETCEAGKVIQSARLLPSQAPHLLSHIFGELCPDGAPVGPRIWEASRFCPAPSTPKGAARRELLYKMIAAIMETGLTLGIVQVTFVASAALAPLARRVGWDVKELGPPRRWGREKLTAMAAEITHEGLGRVRALNAITQPQTAFSSRPLAIAA
jgi:acyl-homoserine lactone synthase